MPRGAKKDLEIWILLPIFVYAIATGFWPFRVRILIFYVLFGFWNFRLPAGDSGELLDYGTRDYLSDSGGLQENQGRDLSENAEYDAAREAQGLLEMRIAKLEDTMANARVIDESKIDKSKVQILSKVTLLNHNNQKQMTYTIVAEHEANLREGKLAIGTPIAKALLGRKKGDRVDVEVPAGTIHFEILDISI